MSELQLHSNGIVIYDDDTKEFFAGFNSWNKMLKYAKIYTRQCHIQSILDKYHYRNLKTCHVEITATLNNQEMR